MAQIFETNNFIIETRDIPHVGRIDGGHIIVSPKIPVEDRTQLSPDLAKELMKLTMVTGEAMKTVLNKNGIDLARINYQDNGNWKPQLHIHLYGRAKSAITQKWGNALRFPSTQEEFLNLPKMEPLNEADLIEISEEIQRLLQTDKYKNF